MLKQITTALMLTTAIVVGGAAFAATEAVNEQMMLQAQNVRKQIETLNKTIAEQKTQVTTKNKEISKLKTQQTTLTKEVSALKTEITKNEQKVHSLTVQANDLETRAHSINGQCKQGSHESIAWIKKHYKNCTKCETTKVSKCDRKTGAHNHYYCYCDC